MNEYGQLAKTHWETVLTTRMQELEDPEGFFTQLGEQVQEQITETTLALEAQTQFSADYLTQVGQRNTLRAQAREMVLHDLVYLPPETPEDDSPELAEDALVRSDGMPTDLTHPLWAASEDDTVTPEQFREQLTQWWATLETKTH